MGGNFLSVISVTWKYCCSLWLLCRPISTSVHTTLTAFDPAVKSVAADPMLVSMSTSVNHADSEWALVLSAAVCLFAFTHKLIAGSCSLCVTSDALTSVIGGTQPRPSLCLSFVTSGSFSSLLNVECSLNPSLGGCVAH